MKRIGVIVAATIAAAMLVFGAGGTASGQNGKPLVFTVGYTQDIDSMNPTIGVTVAAFEAWNIQYATLTDKAAKDFSVTPGLAESWTSSADKKTWTYKLRPNLKWSDGQPLTAEDIAYTVNRSRDEEWLNHTAVVANLSAKATAPDTVVITSKVPDPKLPVMDVYIVPKHIYEKYGAKEVTKYNGQDGVGSGPYVLSEFKKGRARGARRGSRRRAVQHRAHARAPARHARRAHRRAQGARRVAADLLPGRDEGGELLDRGEQRALLRWRQEHVLAGVARRLKGGIDGGREPFDVLVDCQDHVVTAARAGSTTS